MEEGYGILSLIPTLLVFTLAIVTRRPIESLVAGALLGLVMLHGAGFIGVEIALLMQDLGVQVTIVEMKDRLIPKLLESETAKIVLSRVLQRGVEVRLDTQAEAFLGRLDASQTLDFEHLEYISSAGLAILLKTQKRLSESGAALKIINVNKHIYDIFRYSGFNAIFEIETL